MAASKGTSEGADEAHPVRIMRLMRKIDVTQAGAKPQVWHNVYRCPTCGAERRLMADLVKGRDLVCNGRRSQFRKRE